MVEGFNEYARRMPPEARIELVELKAEPRTSGRTAEQMMAAEAQRIAAALPGGATLVVLDERGRDLDTKGLAGAYARWQREGGDIAIVIGGPDGLHASIKERAALLLRVGGALRCSLRHGFGTWQIQTPPDLQGHLGVERPA